MRSGRAVEQLIEMLESSATNGPAQVSVIIRHYPGIHPLLRRSTGTWVDRMKCDAALQKGMSRPWHALPAKKPGFRRGHLMLFASLRDG